MEKKIDLPVKVILAVVMVISFGRMNIATGQTVDTRPTINIGDPVPALKIQKWLKGKGISRFETGQIYVVEFWATWCKPCIAGMPHLSELARKYIKDISVVGISILERAGTPLSKIDSFVASMGNKMDYTVGMEEDKLMAEHWLRASGEQGIPKAYIVDRQGRIAWIGLPRSLDRVLPLVISGKWDIETASRQRKEMQKLSVIDNNMVVTTLNPFMGNPGRPREALDEIAKIVSENPGIEYYPKIGHFTFWSLVKTDPKAAVTFGKAWIAANEDPRYSTITDAVTALANTKKELPKELYLLAADCFQAQLDLYPWSMGFPATYTKMAALYELAGDKEKAVEMIRRSQK